MWFWGGNKLLIFRLPHVNFLSVVDSLGTNGRRKTSTIPMAVLSILLSAKKYISTG